MKTAIFIDGANNFEACKSLGFSVDYDRLLGAFNKDKSLLRAFYYTAVLPGEEGTDKLRPLTDFLAYNGYAVVTKPAKIFTDRMGLSKVKGNMDMEMAVDSLLMADHVDDIILFTGDGDFTYLVRALQQKAVRVTIVSTLCEGISKPPMIADELRRAADIFIDLKHIRKAIERDPQAEGRRRDMEARA